MKKLIYLLIIITLFTACKKKSDFQKGNIFFNEKKYEEALKFYKKATIVIPEADREIIYRKMGISYFNTNENKLAALYLYKTLKLNPEQPEIKMLLAKAYIAIKRYRSAISIVKDFPDSKEKSLILSEAYILSNNVHEGLDYLNKSINKTESKKEKTDIKYTFAKRLMKYSKFCKEKNKLFSELEVEFKSNDKKIEFYDNFYKVLNCNNKEDNTSKKIEILKKLLNKDNLYYQNELTETYIKRKEFKKALSLLIDSKKSKPNQTETLYVEGLYLYYRGKFIDAIAFLEEYLKKDGKKTDALKLLANAQLYSEKYDDAIKNYKKIIENNKFDKDAFLSLKECYEMTKNDKELEKINYEIKKWDTRFYR